MNANRLSRRLTGILAFVWVATLCWSPALAQQKRPMTFMDVMGTRQVGSPALSPDGKYLLYTLSVPDWQAGKHFTDIYLVSVAEGVRSTRQMTSTKDKDETSPQWSRDGKFFAFLSNRDAPSPSSAGGAGREGPGAGGAENQLYMMRPDGGEARKLTDSKGGVAAFAFSRNGKWLAFSAGKPEDRQLWIIPVAGIDTDKPVKLSSHATAIDSWQFSPDSRGIYFISPDSFDKYDKDRKEKKFDVTIRNYEPPPVHLWSIDMDSKKETRLTSSADYSVADVTISMDSKWVGFHGIPNNRYLRTITEAPDYSDLYLLEVGTGKIERLTNNKDIAESRLSFSPDSSTITFAASDDFTYFRNRRVYARPVADAGGKFRKLGENFDGDEGVDFWSPDGKQIYFNEGVGAGRQLFSISVDTGLATQITTEKAVLSVTRDDGNGTVLIHYTDPAMPQNIFTVDRLDRIADRGAWRQLTDSNPQINSIALGQTEAIKWRSTDGTMVEGVLVKPVGYEPGKRYPLIVQIHGGPAGASLLNFQGNSGDYSNVFAGAGYFCLLPNYRGSTDYGEKFKMEIKGEYFPLGYDDIMTGVDNLIALGMVDKDKMGVMGWSAGGHWSDWILTHTNRFKAISTGAGAVNWISMYAQSDIQRNRAYYFDGPPYDNFEHYWNISPLKYIKNAKTPTLIHVVAGDPRVPRPQSEELHMALKTLGVPTEFIVYAGNTHGIPDMRGQMVKMVAEFNWFEKWIKGKQGWFEWKDVMQDLKPDKGGEKKEAPESTPDQQ
jgi:dipeptidyl aminopeptidase/acylaminoacyl peptidase